MAKRRILNLGIVDPIVGIPSPGAIRGEGERSLIGGADRARGADRGRHRVEFVRRRAGAGASCTGDVSSSGGDVVELFARLLQRGGRSVAWATAEGPGGVRGWVEFPGRIDRFHHRCVVVELGLEQDGDSLVVDMRPFPWKKSSALGEVGGRGGGEFVAFGLLAWMYGQDPDEGRRLLENGLADRGRTVVASALRRFELGWRGGPQWAPRLANGGDEAGADGRLPGPSAFAADHRGLLAGGVDFKVGGDFATSGIATRSPGPRAVGGGRQGVAAALMGAAVSAGLDRCLPPPLHPAVGPLLAAYHRRGGRVEQPARRPLAGDGRGSGQPWLVLDVAGEPRDVVDTEAPQVVLRLSRLSEQDGPFLPGETTPLTGTPNPLRLQGGVLAPTGPDELRDAVEQAVRRAREDGRDVTVLLDRALFDGDGQPGGPGPEGTPGPGEVGGAAGGEADGGDMSDPGRTFGPDVSPMNCRAFAPGALAEEEAAGNGVVPLPPVGHLFGDTTGDVLLVGWGTTRAPSEAAALRLRRQGVRASSLHLTQICPLPPTVAGLLEGFGRVVVVEAATEAGSAPARCRTRQLRDLLGDCLRSDSGDSSASVPSLHSWIIPLRRSRTASAAP